MSFTGSLLLFILLVRASKSIRRRLALWTGAQSRTAHSFGTCRKTARRGCRKDGGGTAAANLEHHGAGVGSPGGETNIRQRRCIPGSAPRRVEAGDPPRGQPHQDKRVCEGVSWSIKSSFQLRTYDPEGTIFYGDTKNGRDWFILSLKDGVPLMQISRGGVLVNVAGGPKLNDGRWHTLELSNRGHFVILEVDGSRGLVVGLQSDTIEEVLSGSLRLALGGILIPKEMLFVQFEPQMDACVREGSWLNLSIPWETDADELRPCYQNIRPGSFFPGNGLATFNASVFLTEQERGMTIELWGDFAKMDGTVLSIRPPGRALTFALVTDNNTKEVALVFDGHKLSLKENFKRLQMTFGTDSLEVRHGGHESKVPWDFLSPLKKSGLLSTLRETHVAIGGLLGEDDAGSRFLRGCLEKVQIQGKDVDLDQAAKHESISSHSCPV